MPDPNDLEQLALTGAAQPETLEEMSLPDVIRDEGYGDKRHTIAGYRSVDDRPPAFLTRQGHAAAQRPPAFLTRQGHAAAQRAQAPARFVNPTLEQSAAAPTAAGDGMINPYALVNVGGTSRWSSRTDPGLPAMTKEEVASLDQATQAQVEAAKAKAGAQAAGMKQAAFAQQLAQSQMDFQREKAQEEQAEIKAEAEKYDQETMQPLRDEIRNFEIDQNRTFSGPVGIGKGVAMALAAAAQGFIMGYRGQAGPNPVIQLMQDMIDRDIAVQEADIEKTKGELKDANTVYKAFRQEGLDAQSAANQTHLYLNESLQRELSRIQQVAGAAVSQEASEAVQADLEKSHSMFKIRARQESTPRTVVQRGGSSKRVMAGTLAAKSKAGGKAGAKPDKIPNSVLSQVAESKEFVDRARRFIPQLQNYQRQNQVAREKAGAVGAAITGYIAKTKGILSGSEEARLVGENTGLVGAYTKGISGAAATEAEFDRNRPKMPSFSDRPSMTAKKMATLLGDHIGKLDTMLDMYPDADKSNLLRAQRARLLKEQKKYLFEAGW